MRIIVAGDRFWVCPQLASAIVKRLVERYGPEIVIVHGDGTGVEEAFANACHGHGITAEAHPVSDQGWQRQGDRAVSVRNQWMIPALFHFRQAFASSMAFRIASESACM
jgi:hypothetical protein